MSLSPSRKSGSAPPARGLGRREGSCIPPQAAGFLSGWGGGCLASPIPARRAGPGGGVHGGPICGDRRARGPGSHPPKRGQGALRALKSTGCALPKPSFPESSVSCPRILIKVLCRSAHFQPISHEEARWPRQRRMESCALPCLCGVPGALTRGQHFLAGGFRPHRSNLVSKAGLSSVSGCWFYLSSVS